MAKLTTCLLFLFFSFCINAQPATGKKTEVLLLGTFHFDNPGLDVAQFEDANVLTAKRQQEIEELVKKLIAFQPDAIFIEATPRFQKHFDSLLTAYKNGRYQLTANEIDQLGFRLGKEQNLSTLHCVDYSGANFPFDSLVKVVTAAQQTQMLQNMKKSIDSIQKVHNLRLKTSTITEILLASNSKESREISVGGYFQFLKAGRQDNHVGTYLVSEWWRRNMMIYENILKRLTGNEKRIVVIFGSAHAALLHEFMQYNPDLKLVDVSTVLK